MNMIEELNKANKIIADLNNVLKDVDDKHLAYRIANIKTIRGKLAIAQEEHKEGLRAGNWGSYSILWDICGGKQAYMMFRQNSDAMIADIITQDHNIKIQKRNEKIASKLLPLGVTEVSGSFYARDDSSFTGEYVADTNVGKKNITIQVIIAGGWNVQCMHYRTLVNIK